MKILIILKKWEGGVGMVVKYLSKEFQRRGHKVKIISREEDIKVYSLLRSMFPLRKKIKNLMEEENYDIIYTQDWSLAFPFLFPYSIYKNKHYCCFHGNEKERISLFFQNAIGKIMDKKVVVVGNSLKKRFPKSNLIYNGINPNKFKPIKGIKRIKKSIGFANWKTDEYHFEEIKRAVNKLNKKFIIAENIPKDKMPEFYNKLEMLISLPPKYTGFGLVWLEAMACGVAKIIGNNVGIAIKAPIDKIENFNSIEEAIKNAKKQGYRKWVIKNKFTWKNAAEKLDKIFEKEKKVKF